MDGSRTVEVIRHESVLGRWETAVGKPHVSLRPFVHEYVGGVEETVAPLCRRELPADIAPVIINFGRPFRVFDQADPSRWREIRSFVTGAFDTYTLVASTGAYAVLQINFTILGARLFLGQPLGGLTNTILPLEDALGRYGTRLTEELYDAPTWAARFDLLDRAIAARLHAALAPPPAVSWVVGKLSRHHGQVQIRSLAAEVGWSHKHLVSQFSGELGLGPKTLARVLRFGRAAGRLADASGGHLADIAHDCGYYDQAHFTRDFRSFAGVTPTELLAARLPHRGGFVV